LKALTTFVIVVILASCQRIYTIDPVNPSIGSLKNDVDGDCLGGTVNGTFKSGSILTDLNSIQIQVDVAAAGGYTISTDTINGYYFASSGAFAATGINSVLLKGKGTPIVAGLDDFIVSYNNSHCDIVVPVLPSGSNTDAAFTLGGTGASCTGAVIQGDYTAGIALGDDNKVIIGVNVTATGSYSIGTTTVNGMTFSSAGEFTTTGAQTVTLTGSGTPSTAGDTNVTVNAGNDNCTYTINVLPAPVGNAAFTLAATAGNCSNSDVQGSYVLNTDLDATNIVTLNVDVSAAGNWSITTAATNGMTFSGSGSFSATGAQTISLQGSGTPVTEGDNDISVTAGSSNCSFTVTVNSDPTPPCNPDDNTADLSGVTSIIFTFVSGSASGGSYTITGNGSNGDVILEFANAVQPSPGVYNIQPYAGEFLTGDVHVSFTASDIYWQCSEGLVYVTVANGKVTAVLCGVHFSGDLGGPAFHTDATAKVTELF
jgi:hypothetical protein